MRLIRRPRARGPTRTRLPANFLARAYIRAAAELGLTEAHVAERNMLLSTLLDKVELVKDEPPEISEKLLFDLAIEEFRFGFPKSH